MSEKPGYPCEGSDTDESGRLMALHAYSILDTPPEIEFDRLVRLAAQLCRTPIAALSLVERELASLPASLRQNLHAQLLAAAPGQRAAASTRQAA